MLALRMLPAAVLCNLLLMASPGSAHEFWIEPSPPVLAPGDELTAELRFGSNLTGEPYPYLPVRFERFDIVEGGVARPVHAAIGDLPALRTSVTAPGLLRIVYRSRPSTLLQSDFATFAAYARLQGLDGVVERHHARGLPETGFVEAFTRCAKALVAVGNGAGTDDPVGLPLEIVVEADPYRIAASQPVSARLLWHGEPLPDSQVSIFHRTPDGAVDVRRPRTDAAGRVAIAAAPGFFMLSAVRMTEPDPDVVVETGAAWHSYWASTSFTRGAAPALAASRYRTLWLGTSAGLAFGTLVLAFAWLVLRRRRPR